jgi:hypothetical protein
MPGHMNEKKLTFSPQASKQQDVSTLSSTTQVMKHKTSSLKNPENAFITFK